MDTLKAIFSRPGTNVFAFGLFWVLLNWPVLRIAADIGGFAPINYLFGVWATMIGLMFVKALAKEDKPPGSGDGPR